MALSNNPKSKSLAAMHLLNTLSAGVLLFASITSSSSSSVSVSIFAPARASTVSLIRGTVSLTPMSPSRAPAALPARPDRGTLLARLRSVQEKQIQQLLKLDESVKACLQDSIAVNLKPDFKSDGKQIVGTDVERKLSQLTAQLSGIDRQRAELLARRDVLSQLMIAIDTRWNKQPLQNFLVTQTLDMANADMTNTLSGGRSWKFLTFLSVALREIPDSRDDLIDLIDGYMQFSGVLDPKSPAEYLASREYTNGSVSVTVKPVDRETLGEHLEKRLDELEKLHGPVEVDPMKIKADPEEKQSLSATTDPTKSKASGEPVQ